MDPYGLRERILFHTGKAGRPGHGTHTARKNRLKPCAHGVPFGQECERCNTEVEE